MKFFVLILFIILVYCNNSFAASCTWSTDCLDKQFPYKFCDSGQYKVQCTSNPYSQSGIPLKISPSFYYDQTSYTVFYMQIDTCITIVTEHFFPYKDSSNNEYYGIYNDSIPIYYPGTDSVLTGYMEQTGYHWYSNGSEIIEIYDTRKDTLCTISEPCNTYQKTSSDLVAFNISSITSDVNEEQNAWTNCCSGCDLYDANIQYCNVTIEWSRDVKKFPTDKTTGASPRTTIAITPIRFYDNCTIQCPIYIYLNQTDNFIFDRDDGVEPPVYDFDHHWKWFTTDTTNYNDWYSLKVILMHEMGHVFGFGDEYTGNGKSCATYNSVMNDNNIRNSGYTLSEDDKCMYRKLYCWDPYAVTVKENKEEIISNVNVFPNPVQDNLTISNNFKYYNSKIEIYNIYGQKVLECPYANSIDVSKLTTGVYYLRINNDIIKFGKM